MPLSRPNGAEAFSFFRLSISLSNATSTHLLGSRYQETVPTGQRQKPYCLITCADCLNRLQTIAYLAIEAATGYGDRAWQAAPVRLSGNIGTLSASCSLLFG